jgi:hypothetical protein
MKPAPRPIAPVRQLPPRRYIVQQAKPKDSTVLAGWIIIVLGLGIACIPGIGLLMWVIGVPLCIAAFDFGIIAATRGKTLRGVFLIFGSLAAVGLFLLIPAISSYIGILLGAAKSH